MKQYFALFFTFVLGISLFVQPAEAADPELTIRDNSYAAKYVSQSIPDPITIEAGQTQLVKVYFKNVGTKPWVSSSQNYLSAYTMGPRDRDSVFFGSGWASTQQLGKMAGTVQPGETGEFGVFLHAPDKIGEYTEEFHLAMENWTWVDGGYFFFDVTVVSATKKGEPVAPESTEGDVDEGKAIEYTAKRVGLSKTSVETTGGERIKLVTIYQNLGDSSWNAYSLKSGNGVALAAGNIVSFADSAWAGRKTIVAKNTAVEPGGLTRETFYFRAPEKKGEYTFTAGLHVGEQQVDAFTINVHVTENAPVNYVAPVFDGDEEDVVDPETPKLSEEPRVRVGITTEGTYLKFVSFEDDYTVYDGDIKIGVLEKKRPATIKYKSDTSVYSFDGGGIKEQGASFFRLEPVNDPHAVFTLSNVSRPMKWVGSGDFNKYRGALEYRKGETDNVLYAVNDLLFEDYVKGISETGKSAPIEFVKANLTAARTYAYASLGKYPFFDMLASTYDQLYLGYNVEVHNPHIAMAAEASRGRMVTYDGEVVITPYFGNSGGYTKSWSSVWGGTAKPWLVPVKATYDLRDGRRQFGHGVGMSQRDAAYRAEKEKVNFIELLKYYYTGIEATLMYE